MHAFNLVVSVQVLDAFPVRCLELSVAVGLRTVFFYLIYDKSPIVYLARSPSALKKLGWQLSWPRRGSVDGRLSLSGAIVFISLRFCLFIDN